MARLVMVVELPWLMEEDDAEVIARKLLMGEPEPKCILAQARWADDLETVAELVHDEEDE